MNGLNRYYASTKYESRNSFINQNIKCVFISYQNNDKAKAKKIADYLISAGINVYFDEYDGDLKRTNQSSQPNKVTDSLCKGINNSSHMLVVVSPTTIISKWVPFEIGYGYDKTDLAVLCLKGIPRNTLPEYIRTSKVIRDIYDLNTEISNIRGVPRDLLLENYTIRKHNYSYHDLKNVMDEIIT